MEESMWPELNFEKDFLLPKEILEKQAEEIEIITNGILYVEIEDLKNADVLKFIHADFAFSFILKSKVLQNYEFKILEIEHDLKVYPVQIKIAVDIANELFDNEKEVCIECEKEEIFIEELRRILGSDTVKLTVQNLYRLSR